MEHICHDLAELQWQWQMSAICSSGGPAKEAPTMAASCAERQHIPGLQGFEMLLLSFIEQLSCQNRVKTFVQAEAAHLEALACLVSKS